MQNNWIKVLKSWVQNEKEKKIMEIKLKENVEILRI